MYLGLHVLIWVQNISFYLKLMYPLHLFGSENLFADCIRGCFVVACTLCAFISLVWLREQIVMNGGPDWLEANVVDPVPQVQGVSWHFLLFVFVYSMLGKNSVRTFLGTSHYQNSYMIRANYVLILWKKLKLFLTLQACKLYSQAIVFSNPWWFLGRKWAISTVKDASYHQINFCKLYVEFIQQSVSLHHSCSCLVTAAKQCQDLCTGLSIGSMNYEKFVYNFSLTWLANQTISF